MTNPTSLRAAIATEAARLLLRRKEKNYAAARIRASRWLSRRRVTRDEMPGRDEIEEQLLLLAGLESAEHHEARLREARLAALDLADEVAPNEVRFVGPVVDGPLPPGAEIVLLVEADAIDRFASLPGVTHVDTRDPEATRFIWRRQPCVVRAQRPGASVEDAIDVEAMRGLVAPPEEVLSDTDVATEHALEILHLLLARLDGLRLESRDHPEGDALYHSLQVFEQGRLHRPWDEEFLLACLLHDVGLGIEPRDRVAAGVEALDGLVTERTLGLIAGLPRAMEALRTGSLPRSLRRSDDFDDLMLLARCDRDGRVPGAETCTLEEAFEFVAGLEEEWEDG